MQLPQFFYAFGICSLLLIIACSNSGSNFADKQGSAVALESMPPPPPAEDATQPESGEAAKPNNPYATRQVASAVSTAQTAPISPKIIKTADISYQVDDYRQACIHIANTVANMGGRVATERETRSTHSLNNQFVIHIDPSRFDSLVERLVEPAIYIQHKQINSEDITEQFVDLEARLATRKAVEERYVAILKQAKTIKEILDVEEQLRQIREDIDAAEGKLRYLKARIGESTINLSIYEELPYQRMPEQSFFGRLAKAFVEGWHGLLEIILGLVSAWSFLLLLALVVWFLRRWWKKRQTPATKTKTPPEKP